MLVGVKGVMRARAAAISAVGAAVLYAAMRVGYRQGWGWLDTVDSSSLQLLHDIGVRHPAWVWFWQVWSAVFSPTVFRLVGVLAVVLALLARELRVALFLLISVQLSEVVSQAGKELAGRPRPATALVRAASSAFPSGHAVVSLVAVVSLLVVSWPLLSPRAKATAV